MGDLDFSVLRGDVITKITGAVKDSPRIEFEMASGRKFVMYHSQDCCESVSVESVEGDPQRLVGQRVLYAKEVSNREDPYPTSESGYPPDSYLWTYYTIVTVDQTVVIRWYGTSNGYYSESVDFEEAA